MLSTSLSSAQMFEIGGFVGGSNYIGDVGSSWYIKPNSLAVGGVFKWNASERYAYRASVTFSTLHASDKDSDTFGRFDRGLSFSNRVFEGALGMEFNFWEFDLSPFSRSVTPYIYGGGAVVRYDELYYANLNPGEVAKVTVGSEKKTTFAIPMALGVKAKINTRFVLGAEIGLRYTFTDNLDGSYPSDAAKRFGNVLSDDWYVFSGFTLTYTFGKEPCYSCF
jgi:hypothetical protein